MTTSALNWDAAVARELRPSRAEPTRQTGFDLMRLVASVAIVWAHTPRSEALDWLLPLGSFGTSFFTGASVYFMVRGMQSHPQRRFAEYAEARFVRLYLPFVAWSVLYLLFRDGCRYFLSDKPLVPVEPMMLLSGGETHLWFLPFILLATLLGYPVARVAQQSSAMARMVAALCAVTGLALICNPTPAFTPETDTVNFYRCAWTALPSAFLGLALGLSDEVVAWLRAHAPMTTLAAIAITAVGLAAGVEWGVAVWQKNVAGTAWLLAALSVPRADWQGPAARMAPLAFGLYLVHPLVLGCVRAAAQVVHVPSSGWLDLSCLIGAVAAGLALAWALQRLRRTRWLVP